MAQIDLADLLALYQIPPKTANPAIESASKLATIAATAGSTFPLVRVRGYLTDIALPEADGDLHFFIETEKGAHLHAAPMQTCEIQGLFKKGAGKKGKDSRVASFKQLFAEKVDVHAFLRAWPEHLRDSRQPHLFELHPVLTIGVPGKPPLDFTDRVVWPTGEDEHEAAKSISSLLAPPANLKLKRAGGRIVFATPKHNMKRENYVHTVGYYRGDVKTKGDLRLFSLFDGPQSATSIQCVGLASTAAGDKVSTMKPGRYEVGGLAGLNIKALLGSQPSWATQLCPVLSIRKLP